MDDISLFKKEFKYYKSKIPPPNHDNVIDFNNIDKDSPPSEIEVLTPSECGSCSPMETYVASFLKSPSEWDIFEIKNKPGLIFVKNPFTKIGQRYWICRSLRDYTRKPHLLNLDAHTTTQLSRDWWDTCQGTDKRSKSLRKQLRWATMGYHHDWNTKVYSDASKDQFPVDLAALSSYVAQVLGFRDDFSAEAAIVNFYHFDSTLSGHTDHSEIDIAAPLFSFSFGQTAIFLLGGLVTDEKPVPLFIRSGDIVVMSGFSRQCYHGIPKILPATSCPWDFGTSPPKIKKSDLLPQPLKQDFECEKVVNYKCQEEEKETDYSEENLDEICMETKLCRHDLSIKTLLDDTFWKPFREYVSHSRVNLNVRQVLPKGHKTLNKQT